MGLLNSKENVFKYTFFIYLSILTLIFIFRDSENIKNKEIKEVKITINNFKELKKKKKINKFKEEKSIKKLWKNVKTQKEKIKKIKKNKKIKKKNIKNIKKDDIIIKNKKIINRNMKNQKIKKYNMKRTAMEKIVSLIYSNWNVDKDLFFSKEDVVLVQLSIEPNNKVSYIFKNSSKKISLNLSIIEAIKGLEKEIKLTNIKLNKKLTFLVNFDPENI